MEFKHNFSKITIRLASPESIKENSKGEVINDEKIDASGNCKNGGLFCEKIFGTTRDWHCQCGEYKFKRDKGIVCDKCGVEVTESTVRRKRTGHIKLVVPVVNPLFLKYIPYLIDLHEPTIKENKSEKKYAFLSELYKSKTTQLKTLMDVIYCQTYVVTVPGIKEADGVKELDCLDIDEYDGIIDSLPVGNQSLEDSDSMKFIAKTGSEAIYDLLSRIKLDELALELNSIIRNPDALEQHIKNAKKRLKWIEAFIRANEHIENRPEWMVIKALPVIPPELRPNFIAEDGNEVNTDLNKLYISVIQRNNRIKEFKEKKDTPGIILRNEKRLLQIAVDNLFDNPKPKDNKQSNKVLKSLSARLRGKSGRFRQSLLGKRVDYSGRSVIVVGPELKLHECGLPKEMAAKLFKPFIIRRLINRGIVKYKKSSDKNIDRRNLLKSAEKIVDKREAVIWEILEDVVKGHPILLNRAPTLHRLGVLAFQPKLIEGEAIQVHPLVCTGFGADFDGDQMAVHVPLGNAAILEAQILMLASHNILNPRDGNPITVPSQDMLLGLYYMTKAKKTTKEEPVKGSGLTFYSAEEAIIAFNEKKIDLHAIVRVRASVKENEIFTKKLIETTMGRILFNQEVPEEMGFVNELLTKKNLSEIISDVLKVSGMVKTAKFLDDIKDLGYYYAFKGGLSFNLNDLVVPKEKEQMIANANSQIKEVEAKYNLKSITENERNERYHQVIKIWTGTNSKITTKVMEQLSSDRQGFNSIYMMLDSGARGSKEQIRQLSGMRGLMSKPQKSGTTKHNTLENPVISNLKEGLSIHDYFISTHGSRKGLSDTAVKTADAGYLTRRLVDVSQDITITDEDCGTSNGLMVTSNLKNDSSSEKNGDRLLGEVSKQDVYDFVTNKLIVEAGERITEKHIEIINKSEIAKEAKIFYDKILGRISLHDVHHPLTNDLIVARDEEITEYHAEKIKNSLIESVEIRSVLTCEMPTCVCSKCYGRNLATGRMVQKGEAVGIIAAQSIGEPGTQLTLRTFHTGGVATVSGDITGGLPIINELFEAIDPENPAIFSKIEGVVNFVELSEKEEKLRKIRKEDTQKITIKSNSGKKKSYNILSKHLKVENNDFVNTGQQLSEGKITLSDTLILKGPAAVRDRLLKELPVEFLKQGIKINSKHFELIIRQMMRYVKIVEPGDTKFRENQIIEMEEFTINPMLGKVHLVGITRNSLNTKSFVSAAAFQNTTNVLAEAALNGKVDDLSGIKENVIIGRLIPVGTGNRRDESD